jgi:hypothetical protein
VAADVFERVRAGCAAVVERAAWLRLDERALAALCEELAGAPPPDPAGDPAHRPLGAEEATLAWVVTLGAINFGSGWFPHLAKRPGCSGYFTIAGALRDHFAARGPWKAEELVRLDAAECARVFGQDPARAEVGELMALFAAALGDLGRFLCGRYAGSFAGPVDEAAGSAARLVGILASMPFYRDVARLGSIEVPFYKRAQLTCADLAEAFRGSGRGAFRDLDRLTAFADNLVPHVLRCAGVLVYDADLARRIDAGELLAPGCAEEVEIRAAAVHAVERCVDRLGGPARGVCAHRIDALLWNRGQRPEIKARPRHRTRCVFY